MFSYIDKKTLSSLFTALIAFSSPLQASELLSEEDLYFELPLTLTATRIPQSVANSPVSITTIDRDMIEAYDPAELVDVLRLVPGFQVIHPKGHRASITYHGLADEYARRMQVLVDGRSVYSPLLGHVEWSSIPLEVEDIERIEVVRGPNAASYGANSFSAIVNIITRHPADYDGNYIKLKTGSQRYRKVVARHSGNSGKLDYRLSLSYRGDEGYDDPLSPDDKRIGSLSFRSNYQLDAHNELEFQFGHNSDIYQDGEPGDNINVPRRESTLNNFQMLRWRHNVSPSEDVSLQFYHNYQYVDADFYTNEISSFVDNPALLSALGLNGDEQIFLSNSHALHRYDLELQHSFVPAPDWRLVWGASARLDRVGSAFFFNRESNRDYLNNRVYRLFAHTEWSLSPGWTINAGLMLENNDISGTDLSPRISVNHHFDHQNSLRVSMSKALRTPSTLEFEGLSYSRLPDGRAFDQNFQPNNNLDPEEINSFEIAYTGNFPHHGLSVDAKLFYDRIDNVIASYSDRNFNDPINDLLGLPASTIRGEVLTTRNNSATHIKGLEAQLQYRPNRKTRIHLGYTIAKGSGRTLKFINGGGAADETGYDVVKEEIPRTMGTMQLIYDLEPDIRTSFSLHRYSKYNPKGGDDTGDFSIVNVRIAKHFKVAQSDMQLAASFQNISDDYFDYQETRLFDNRLFLSFEATFK